MLGAALAQALRCLCCGPQDRSLFVCRFYGVPGTLLVYSFDMAKKSNSLLNQLPGRKALLGVALALTLATLACVRSATADSQDTGAATERSAETADAEIQQTLEALLGSATVQNAAATSTAMSAASSPAATATIEQVQLTALSETLTAAAASPTSELALAVTPSATSTAEATDAPCYAARYVYDETYSDGTRVNPGESIQKVWRLQNVGTCDWQAGQYQLVFVSGDRMSGSSPLVIYFAVPAGGYANFAINLTVPATPGTYHGNWVLQLTSSGDVIGLEGAGADQSFWIEIVVRGASPTP